MTHSPKPLASGATNHPSRPLRGRRFALALSALLLSALVAAGCGVPEDSSPRALFPATPTPVLAAPTSTPVETEAFTIYLIDSEGRVRQAERQLPDRLTVTALVDELREIPTEEETELGLVSVIPQETTLIADPSTDASGLAILNFAAGSLDTLEVDRLKLALAQLVWTLTESPTISRLIIRIEGNEERFPTDDEDRSVLRRSNYASLDPNFVAPTPEPVDPEPPTEEDPSPVPTPVPDATGTPGADDGTGDGDVTDGDDSQDGG